MKQIAFFIILFILAGAIGGTLFYYMQQSQDFDAGSRIEVTGISYDDEKCATYDVGVCPTEHCQACSSCPLCNDLQCRSKEFCENPE